MRVKDSVQQSAVSNSFLLLVLAQGAHSVEECVWPMYDVYAPARMVAGLVSSNLAVGFALANAAVVVAGLWCWRMPVRGRWRFTPMVVWGWIVLELVNGINHSAMAVVRGGYFPGVATAPLLLAAAGRLAILQMRARGD